MKPTYKILPNYDHLIEPAVFQNYSKDNADLEMTIEAIKEVVQRFRQQVSKLAKHLKGNSLEQSAFNLWHWEINNLRYAPDQDGEELRTPARAYADGQPGGPGVDCDCITMFGASVLLENGYDITMNIVALNHNPNFAHIFLSVGKISTYHPDIKGYVIDPCPPLTKFNQLAPNITKVMKLSILKGLGGLGTMEASFNKSGADAAPQENQNDLDCPLIFGINGFAAPDAITIKLLVQQSDLKKALHTQPFNQQFQRELRKISFVIGLNNMPEERAKILSIMPYVQDIASNGQYVFKPGMQPEVIGAFLAGIISEDELGNIFKSIGKSLKHITSDIAKVAKHVAEEIKKDAGKALKFVVKFTPIMILMRSGVKAAMFENVHGWASKLNIGILQPEEAAAKGYSRAEWQQRRDQLNHLARQFKDIGGDEGHLFSSIRQGANKKMLFGLEEMEGLGEPITLAAGITAAAAILVPLAKALSKGNEKDKDGKPVSFLEKLAQTVGYDTSKNFMDNVQSFGKTVKDMTHSITEAPGSINKAKATIGIVGVGLIAAILLGSKKGKGKSNKAA